MRALAAAALSLGLALSACSVDVEGAPCRTAGTTADCPSGQACGVDARCSTRAAQCTGAGDRCDPGARRCGQGDRTETCTASDPCGAWEFLATDEDCAAGHLVCDDAGGSPACVCAAPQADIVVDRSATNPRALSPTGADAPEGCRFTTITAALAYARDVWRPAHAGAPATVRAAGAPSAASPVVFDAESFPVVVPSGVTLTTSSQPPAPELWVISANPQAAKNVVELESGAVLEGWTIRSVSATRDALVATCNADVASAAARNVNVDGNGVARYGLSVTGTCGLEGSDLVITGATKSGVLVNTASSDVGVTLTGGSVHGNAESGADVLGGLLSIQGRSGPSGDLLFDLGPNTRHGVHVAPGPSAKTVDVRLNLVDVHEHGEAGVFVKDLPAASKVHVTSCRIRKNTGTAAYSVYGSGRIAGGVLLWGAMPSEVEFQRNTVCANATDQIGVYSDDPWNLSAADCTASNVFVRPGTGYYVYSTTELPDVEVAAINNRWSPNPPTTSLVVKTAYAPSCGSVSAVPSFCQ